MLLSLQEELHKTIVFITHDLDEALRIGDTIAILRDGAVIQQGTPQETILYPVDDYIYDFIKDINRSRVIQTKSVMTPGEAVDSSLTLSHDLVLEEAIQLVTATKSMQGNVVDENGKVIGSVSLKQIVDGIARPAAASGDDVQFR